MRRALAVLALGGVVALTPVEAPSCGPFFETAIFEPKEVPSVAVRDYNAGKLGIVLRSFELHYLMTAWRFLNGQSLDASVWSQPSEEPPVEVLWKRWLAERAKVVKDPLPEWPAAYRRVPGSQWAQFLNCSGNAYATAQLTLDERIAGLGAFDPAVVAWVKAQDTVFSNCEDGAKVPPEPEPTMAPEQKADRDYQIASAHFYATNFDEARTRFLAISKDATSPWQSMGRYLAARCLVRKGTLKPGEGEIDQASLRQAEDELQDLAHTAVNPGIKAASARLASYVSGKLHPAQQLVRTAKLLASPRNDASFRRNWNDFKLLLRSPAAKDAAGANEMLDWFLAMRGGISDEQVVEQWKKSNSEAWLVAALSVVTPNGPRAAELLDAARQVSPDSPAYPTAAYYRLYLSPGLESNTKRDLLDQMVANVRMHQPAPALNFFLHERLPLARTYADFLRDAQRAPAAMLQVQYDPWPAHAPAVLFDEDSVAVFHSALPLSRWVSAAENTAVPAHLRARILRAAWARAVLSGDHALGVKLAPAVAKAYPGVAAPLTAYAEATPEQREFLGAWTMLKAPGLQPYMRPGLDRREQLHERSGFRDNWWCGGEQVRPVAQPPFLTDNDRQEYASEASRLQQHGAAVNYFASVLVPWAEANASDPRAPEALHLTVASSRSGCVDANTLSSSKRAFQTLHKLFPKSEWAKKTPYYYGK